MIFANALLTGCPRLLFDIDRTFTTFEIAPDGQRFLMTMNDEAAEQVPTRVIVNWPAMIRRSVWTTGDTLVLTVDTMAT